MKILETERLLLQKLTPDDADFMFALMNEPAFIRNVADRGIRQCSDAAAYISEKILPSYANYGFGFYRVDLKESALPIGICGLAKRETLDDVDVGFSILERYWRKGYAFEAALAMMEYGRNTLGLKRITGLTSSQNEASIRLLEKLGLRFDRRVSVPGFGTESLLFS
ncbi:MAG: GNAT family N-acetyltransferase [Spartobacteria bacterium]